MKTIMNLFYISPASFFLMNTPLLPPFSSNSPFCKKKIKFNLFICKIQHPNKNAFQDWIIDIKGFRRIKRSACFWIIVTTSHKFRCARYTATTFNTNHFGANYSRSKQSQLIIKTKTVTNARVWNLRKRNYYYINFYSIVPLFSPF